MSIKRISEMSEEEFEKLGKKIQKSLNREQYKQLKKKYGNEITKNFMQFQEQLREDKKFRKRWHIKHFLRNEITQFYLNEAIKLYNNQQYLPLIFSIGCFTEIFIEYLFEDYLSEEIPDGYKLVDYDFRLFNLLKDLLKNKEITKEQYNLFDRIRKIRNKHVHPNFGKIVEDEYVQKKILLENSINKIIAERYKETIKKDASEIIILFKELIKTFN